MNGICTEAEASASTDAGVDYGERQRAFFARAQAKRAVYTHGTAAETQRRQQIMAQLGMDRAGLDALTQEHQAMATSEGGLTAVAADGGSPLAVSSEAMPCPGPATGGGPAVSPLPPAAAGAGGGGVVGPGVAVGAGTGAGEHGGVSLLRTMVQCEGNDGTQGSATTAIAGKDAGTDTADAHADDSSSA